MTDAKKKIVMQKRHKTMLASKELNAEDHPLVRDILVIHEDCAALMCERRG